MATKDFPIFPNDNEAISALVSPRLDFRLAILALVVNPIHYTVAFHYRRT